MDSLAFCPSIFIGGGGDHPSPPPPPPVINISGVVGYIVGETESYNFLTEKIWMLKILLLTPIFAKIRTVAT